MRKQEEVAAMQRHVARRIAWLIEHEGLDFYHTPHEVLDDNVAAEAITSTDPPEVLIDGLGEMTLLVIKVEHD